MSTNNEDKPSVAKPSIQKPSVAKPSVGKPGKGGGGGGMMGKMTGKGGKKGGTRVKPRHQSRRYRFRQGMWNAGQSLRPLDEEDDREVEDYLAELESVEEGDADAQTAAITTFGGATAFSFKGSTKKKNGEGGLFSGCCCQCGLALMLLLVVGGGVMAILYFFVGVFDSTESSAQEMTAVPAADAVEDLAPVNPYEGIDFTWDPSVLDEENELQPVRDLLPEFTRKAMEDLTSPQSLAVQWVEEHPSHLELPNWKKLQLVAVASFYFSFNGNGWPADKRKDWLSYEVDECSWGDKGEDGSYWGVGCTEGINGTDSTRRFTDLNIDYFVGFGMVGFPDAATGNQMPPELVFLQELKTLGLMNCGLKAMMVNLLPPTLSQLPNLTRLSFKFNNIAGTIPNNVGELTNLETLSLGSNFLTGTLPASVGQLTELEELYLQSNQLKGSMPYGWNKLNKLREFNAIQNQLTGSIPAYVGDWNKLQFFFIDHNPLQGSLPTEVCALPELTSFLLPCSVGCAQDCGEKCECYED